MGYKENSKVTLCIAVSDETHILLYDNKTFEDVSTQKALHFSKISIKFTCSD
jgi:hypothetical protein